MTRTSLFLIVSCLLVGGALSSHAATTQCQYEFTSGTGNTFLHFCVTANGNIPLIETPSGIQLMVGPGGEGYGLCDATPIANYTDFGVSDTGNWNSPTLVSKSSSYVKIVRLTSDGHWTLTQTITKVASPPSIKVVMALTNNQSIDATAYLLRFASSFVNLQVASLNGVLSWSDNNTEPNYGLLLQNVATPPFVYWKGFVQNVTTGPNACNWAANDTGNDINIIYFSTGSMQFVCAGTVPALGTKTVTLTYRGM